jgi:riboflavin kinase/FMN adenylyltransferase
MEILTYQDQPFKSASSVALGYFDGVHLGHQLIIKNCIAQAKEYNLKSVVVTFKDHPRTLITKNRPKIINNLETKLNLFRTLGLDACLLLDFDEQMMQTSAQDYLDKYLKVFLNTKAISVGFNHHFGARRSGTPEFLKQWCFENEVSLNVTEQHKLNQKTINSSVIRDLLADVELGEANRLLGYDFYLISKIISGDQIGTKLGYPTANLDLGLNELALATGVYEAEAEILNDLPDTYEPAQQKTVGQILTEKLHTYKAAVNIGVRPTVNGKSYRVEAHLLNFKGDLYGKYLKLTFKKRIRYEKTFNDLSELKTQIANDIQLIQQDSKKLFN